MMWRTGGRRAVGGLMAVMFMAGGCSNSERVRSSGVDPKYGTTPSPRLYTEHQQIPKGGGAYKLGAPYSIAGRLYVPTDDRTYDKTGVASWYGADFHGRKTANGEIFDMWALTAAHPTLPIPSYVYVTNEANGRTALVRLNDRGPYAHDRVIDLSRMTARVLGTEAKGLAQVRVRYAGPAPLSGDDSAERRYLAGQPWANGQTLAGLRGNDLAGAPRFGSNGRMSLGVGLAGWEGLSDEAQRDAGAR